LSILEAAVLLAAAWTIAGLLYWWKNKGRREGERRIVLYPFFFMLRIPYGFESWGRYKDTIIAKAYTIFTHTSAAAGLAGIYYLLIHGFYTKYISPPKPGGVEGFIPLIPGVTVKGPLLAYIALAVGVGAFFHELSHAFAARASGIRVKNAGIMLLAFIPAAFVEPDEEELRRASLRARAFVYNAGTAANMAIALIALAALYLLVPPPAGVCVTSVDHGMPAEKAGLRPGDIITAVNGVPVGEGGFSKVYPTIPAGVNFTLTIKRGGQVFNVTVWKVEKGNRSLIGIGVLDGIFCSTGSLTAYTMYWINLSLALVNMAPLYITDGGRLVNDLLERYRWGKNASNVIQAATLILFLSLITIPH